MKKILLVDFHDSFTFNIASELHKLNLEVEIHNYEKQVSCKKFDGLVWGPGPGHPIDYQKYFGYLNEQLQSNLPLLAICLGHQIYWHLLGETIEKSQTPLHGEVESYDLDTFWKNFFHLKTDRISVQRYNSLAVKAPLKYKTNSNLFIQDNELIMSCNKRHITYQFHPESIGTSDRQIFFRPYIQQLKL
jgi:anthranilate/para-aminobenzoate synthase component II